MEIGEKLKHILRKRESMRTEPEVVNFEPIDVLSGNFVFHYAPRDKLEIILKTGVYSAAFARRIGDKGYKKSQDISDDKYVYTTVQPYNIYPTDGVGFAIKRTESGERTSTPEFHLRVAPREFLALLVPERVTERHTQDLVQYVVDVQKKNKGFKLLPIYGESGNLLWPKRMPRAEIVQMLKGKAGSGGNSGSTEI